MIEIDWLNSLLEQNSQRDITKQLWLYNDKVIATNGIAMIAVNADMVDFASANINTLSDIFLVSEILSYEYRSIASYNTKVNLQDFKEWLGEPEHAKECGCKNVVRKCPNCSGQGVERCNLGEEHDCTECNGKGQYYCDKCDDGWIKPEKRYVGIFDVVVNGNVLAKYLEELHDVNAIISCNGEKPVKFSGDGWDVYIMPIKDVRQKVRRYDSKRIDK